MIQNVANETEKKGLIVRKLNALFSVKGTTQDANYEFSTSESR